MTKKKTEEKKFKRTLRGVVVSDKMDKTVIVLVDRYLKHSRYGKFYKKSKRYKAHDESNKYGVGDKVAIEEAVPMSKDKTFVVKELLRKAGA